MTTRHESMPSAEDWRELVGVGQPRPRRVAKAGGRLATGALATMSGLTVVAVLILLIQ